MIGSLLLRRALAQAPAPDPELAALRERLSQIMRENRPTLARPPEPSRYVVVLTDEYGHHHLSHTTLMDRDEAEREAVAWRRQGRVARALPMAGLPE
jgi:hypothetical protein